MIPIGEGSAAKGHGATSSGCLSVAVRLGQPSSRLANVIEQFLGFPKDLAHLGSLPKRVFGVGSMLPRILVAFWRARPPSAAMHATAPLAAHGG